MTNLTDEQLNAYKSYWKDDIVTALVDAILDKRHGFGMIAETTDIAAIRKLASGYPKTYVYRGVLEELLSEFDNVSVRT